MKNFILASAIIALLTACGSTPTNTSENAASKQTTAIYKRLSKTLTGKKLASNGKFGEKNTFFCPEYSKNIAMENALKQWSVNQIEYNKNRQEDLLIWYSLTCDLVISNKSIAVTLMSLGVLPVSRENTVTMGIKVYKKDKILFQSDYSEKEQVNDYLYMGKPDNKFDLMFGRIFERFSRDIERDGALDE